MKTVLFQAIQLSISTLFSSIWPIDRTLSGAITPGQSGPGSDGNEGELHIPQSTSITGTSPSDFLVSYLEHSLEGSYPSAEKQSVYSTASADWQWSDWFHWIKRNFFQAVTVLLSLYGCPTRVPRKRLENKLDGIYKRILPVVLEKSWKQHQTK